MVDSAALISAGQLSPDCSDLAFAERDGSLDPHWIESGCGTGATRIWVRRAAVASGESEIAMHYGGPAGSPNGNGPATFLFFDDFDDSDASDWAMSVELLDTADAHAERVSTETFASSPASVELYGVSSCLAPPFDGVVPRASRRLDLEPDNYSLDFAARTDILAFTFSTTARTYLSVTVDDLLVLSTETLACNGNGCTASTGWETRRIPIVNLGIGELAIKHRSGDCVTSSMWFDDVRLRRRAVPGPTVSVLGAARSCP